MLRGMKTLPSCGTRAAYVGRKCRCEACRQANVAYYHQRAQQAREAVASRVVAPASGTVPQEWTAPDGTKRVRHYRQPCPGVDGKPCPAQSHLRKDSLGGLCRWCRAELVADPLVPIDAARAHLKALSDKGVGKRSVQAASDVGLAIIAAILRGTRRHIRRSTERRLLAVDVGALADGTLVDARPTWKLIRAMLRDGYTRGELAEALGSQKPALQLGRKRLLASTALKVERLHRAYLQEKQQAAQAAALCRECGLAHGKSERLERLRRALPSPKSALLERWPCVYEAEEKLTQDLKSLGAAHLHGTWHLPAPQSTPGPAPLEAACTS